MVEYLLGHGISSANIKAALTISWANDQDDITGLLLEHIAVGRSRDLVTLSGLELTTLKPLWILPSLGVKLKVDTSTKRQHKMEGSLGHVKLNLLNRKSASELVVVDTDSVTPLRYTYNSHTAGCCRKAVVDITALKYLSDKDKTVGLDEHDGRSVSPASLNHSCAKQLERSALQKLKFNDSGLHRSGTTTNLIVSNRAGISSPMLCEVNTSVMSWTSFHRRAQGAISGAKSLPRCQLDRYATDNTDGISAYNLSDSNNLGDFSLSPAQLRRQVRRVRDKGRAGIKKKNSFIGSLSDLSLPVHIGQRSHSNVSVNNCTSTDVLQQSGTSVVGANISCADEADTSESSVLMTPSSLPCGPSRLLLPKSNPNHLASEAEAKPLSEQEKAVSDHRINNLIKVFDLSSNQLKNFFDLMELPYGGEFLFKLLRCVRRLDVKQNQLADLPMDMMKVCSPA